MWRGGGALETRLAKRTHGPQTGSLARWSTEPGQVRTESDFDAHANAIESDTESRIRLLYGEA